MIATPHSWAELRAEATRLGIRIVADAGGRESLAELEDRHSALVAEADDLFVASNHRDLTDEEQSRWDTLMDKQGGELATVSAKLEAERKRRDQIKALAVARSNGNRRRDPFGGPVEADGGNNATEGSNLRFRDERTGETIQALTHADRVFDTLQPTASGSGYDTASGAVEAFGHGLRNLLLGRPNGVSAAFMGGDDRGGFLTEESVSAAIIDLARSATVALRAGARTITMDSAETSIVQLTEDPEAVWRAELQPVKSSDVRFSRVVLRPKTLAAIVPLSEELIDDANANIVDIVSSAVSNVMGLALDRAILGGVGAKSEPLGIRNTPGVGAVAAVGAPQDYAAVSRAVQSIYSANYPGEPSSLAWVMSPRDAGTYDNLTAGDNQPLMPTPWAAALQRYPTTSMPTDLGDGSDESEMIVADFTQVVLGMRRGITIRLMEAGTVTDAGGNTINAVSQIARLLVVHMRADVAVVRPSWLSVLSGVTAPAP